MSYKWEHKYNMSYKVNKVAKFELEKLDKMFRNRQTEDFNNTLKII